MDNLDSTIIVAILSFLGTALGSIASIAATSKLTQYRIKKLEEKVDSHNQMIDRVYKLEEHNQVQDSKLEYHDTCIEAIEHKIEKLGEFHSQII